MTFFKVTNYSNHLGGTRECIFHWRKKSFYLPIGDRGPGECWPWWPWCNGWWLSFVSASNILSLNHQMINYLVRWSVIIFCICIKYLIIQWTLKYDHLVRWLVIIFSLHQKSLNIKHVNLLRELVVIRDAEKQYE